MTPTVKRARKSAEVDTTTKATKKTTTKAKKGKTVEAEPAEKASYSDLVQGIVSHINSTSKTVDGSPMVQLMEGSSGRWAPEDVIRSGSLSLDMAIGIGGLPRGRVIELAGNPSAGKTSLAYCAVGNAQRAGIVCFYLDAEQSFDRAWAAKMGVDNSTLIVNQNNSLEEAIDFALEQMHAVAEQTGEGPLIVFDSASAFITKDVQSKGASDNAKIGNVAQIWSTQLSKLMAAAAKTKSTLVIINQYRAKFNAQYVTQETTGGSALKYGFSLRVKLTRKEVVEQKKGYDKEYKGQKTTFETVKNKVSSPFNIAHSYMPKGQGFDWLADIIDCGIASGVVLKDVKAEKNSEGLVSLTRSGNSYTYILSRSEVDYLNEVMPSEVDRKRRIEQARHEFAMSKGRVYEPREIDDWEPLEYGDFIYAYHRGPFETKLRAFPELLSLIEQRILNTLTEPDNDSDEFIDPETIGVKNTDSSRYAYDGRFGDLGGDFTFDD